MTTNTLPYLWEADASHTLADLLQHGQKDIDSLLFQHGAVLFRNFKIDTIDKFQECTDKLRSKAANYIDGNSPRTKLTSNIYTSTEYPPELPISMHNELSYSHAWPSRLYFCCITAPATGGSTLIADSRAMLRNLSSDVVSLFEEKGVSYIRNLHGGSGVTMGKSWQQTFETEERAVVERYCKEGAIRHEWKHDGGLRLTQTRPSLAVHPVTGEKVWFNQVDQFHPSTNPPEVYEAIMDIFGDTPFDMPQYGCFGDGTPISDDILAQVRAQMERETVAFPWEKGDLLMIDNMLTAHGRSPFTGERKILVAMSS